MLGRFWSACIIASFTASLGQLIFFNQQQIFDQAIAALFDVAEVSVEISIGLIGLMSLWLGFFKIAERAGLVETIARGLNPLFCKLMPELPNNHPAISGITMNMGANALGLDNAATPFGIKAMHDLQTINPHKEELSNAQILFLVLNTSSVTVLPVTVFLFRAQYGASQPSEVFVPILIATSVSTLVGLLSVAYVQKLALLNRTVLTYLAILTTIPLGLTVYFTALPAEQMSIQAALFANFVLFAVIVYFLLVGLIRKVPVYDAFIDGAKQGFDVAIKLIPYLIAMLIAIALLRVSGLLDVLLVALSFILQFTHIDTAFLEAMPTALMKPFSGSGARAAMIDVMQTHGVDSFPAKVAAVMQGSTETTFYVLAVYCGAVGISKIRYALSCSLLADTSGITAAIVLSYVFFA